MAQQFIVEGNDGYVLSALCLAGGLTPPVGYEDRKKYKRFVIDAGGISRVSDAIKVALAIQEEPGMNAQTAVKKGILDHTNPLAQNFLTWFAATFELS